MLAFAIQAVAAFNLVCTGVRTHGEMLRPPQGTPEQVLVIYRVDLEQRRWCAGECTTTQPLQSITDTRITFNAEGDVMRQQSPDTMDSVTMVNRENGEYLDRLRVWTGTTYRVLMTSGTCERAPFTGFPQRRF